MMGQSPFMLAVVSGKTEVAEYLIQQGAEIDKKMGKGLISGQDEAIGYRGITALGVAAEAGDLNMVKLLMKNGADCTIKVDGKPYNKMTPVEIAKENGNFEVVNFLIEEADKAFVNASVTPSFLSMFAIISQKLRPMTQRQKIVDAINNGNYDAVASLVNNTNVNNTLEVGGYAAPYPLELALSQRRDNQYAKQIAWLLVTKGANVVSDKVKLHFHKYNGGSYHASLSTSLMLGGDQISPPEGEDPVNYGPQHFSTKDHAKLLISNNIVKPKFIVNQDLDNQEHPIPDLPFINEFIAELFIPRAIATSASSNASLTQQISALVLEYTDITAEHADRIGAIIVNKIATMSGAELESQKTTYLLQGQNVDLEGRANAKRRKINEISNDGVRNRYPSWAATGCNIS